MPRKQTVATNLTVGPMAEREILSTQVEICRTLWACFAHPTESPTSLFLSHPATQKGLIRMPLPHMCHRALVPQIHSNIPATSVAPMVLPVCTQRRANGSTGSRACRSTPKSLFLPFLLLNLRSSSPISVQSSDPALPLPTCVLSHIMGLVLAVKRDSL